MTHKSFWGLPTVEEIKLMDDTAQIFDLAIKIAKQDGYIRGKDSVAQERYIDNAIAACRKSLLKNDSKVTEGN